MGYALIWIFIVWHYALRCGFISDDHSTIEKRKDIIPDAEKNPKFEDYWVKVFNDGIIIYYWDRLMERLHLRDKAFVWHLASVSLHLINVCLLYLVLKPLLGAEISMTACFFWAINPMLNQNVVWISGRPYMISTCIAFICLLFWQYPLLVLPLFAIGVVANISIAPLPIMIYMLHPSWQGILYIVVMFVFGMPFMVWKFHRRFTSALVLDRENFNWKKRKFNAVVRTYLYYIWTVLCPLRMGWYHQAGFRYNEKWLKFNIYTLVAYVVMFWVVKQGVFGWWFILFLMPNINIFATNSFLQDRYVYLASIGLAVIAAPYLWENLPLFYIFGTFYGVRSYMYSRHLINDESMYRENWRLHPNSDYAINNLSFFLIQQKRFDESRVVILRGLVIQPANKMLWYNLGVTWAAQGHFNTDEGKFKFLRAVDCWKKALEIEPRWLKPAEDLQKLVKLLVEKKVLTPDKNQSAGGQAFEVPVKV